MKPSPKSEEFTTFAINGSEPDISEFCSKQVISNAEATLLLIDPAEISRVSLVNLIGTHCPGISVEVAPKSEKISADSRPDVVLLDIKSAEIEGREVLQQIAQVRARFPNKPIVILSDCTSSGLAEAALRLGLSGCIPYSMGINTTYAAIRLVLLGGTFFPRESLQCAGPLTEGGEPELHGRGKVDDPTSPTSDRDHPHLTCRECDVVSKLRECKPNKIIAHELGMSISTVKVHIRNIMRKLGATNRMQVALMSDVSGHPHRRVESSTNS